MKSYKVIWRQNCELKLFKTVEASSEKAAIKKIIKQIKLGDLDLNDHIAWWPQDEGDDFCVSEE